LRSAIVQYLVTSSKLPHTERVGERRKRLVLISLRKTLRCRSRRRRRTTPTYVQRRLRVSVASRRRRSPRQEQVGHDEDQHRSTYGARRNRTDAYRLGHGIRLRRNPEDHPEKDPNREQERPEEASKRIVPLLDRSEKKMASVRPSKSRYTLSRTNAVVRKVPIAVMIASI